MKKLDPTDSELLARLRGSKEYIALDKLIRIRINNLREVALESLRNENTFFNAKTSADQIFILEELIEELDKYKDKDEEDDK